MHILREHDNRERARWKDPEHQSETNVASAAFLKHKDDREEVSRMLVRPGLLQTRSYCSFSSLKLTLLLTNPSV